MIFSNSKKKRVIDCLRERFGGNWKYEYHNRWVSDDGKEITRCAKFAPRFDGDDDSFVIVYYDNNGERIYGLPLGGKLC